MIKPTTLVLLVTLLFSSLGATLPAESEPAASSHALHLLAPSRLRGAVETADFPAKERKLQQSPLCYLSGYPPPGVSCDALTCSGSTCCADDVTCWEEAGKDSSCQKLNGGFKISNPNLTNCTWQYSCCTVPVVDQMQAFAGEQHR